MQKEMLSDSGVLVSKICLGTMTWGEQNTEQDAHQQLAYALKHGVNFIDTAEMYPVPPNAKTQGLTEQYIGSWLAKTGARNDVVLASKVAGPGAWLSYLRGGPRLNREHILSALDGSLDRLQTEYLDLYQLHWPERSTNYFGQLGYRHNKDEESISLKETLQAIKEALGSGKIRHWGLSNETPWGLMTSLKLAEELNMPKPVSIQNPYNLLNRSFEVGLAECAHRENVGLLAYSPLAFGVLSGKYLGGARPAGARISLFDRFTRYTHSRAEEAVAAYVKLAKQHSMSPSLLALAFVNSQGFVTSNIIGATTMEQLAENISSAEVCLSPEVLEALDALHRLHTIPCP